jgi:lysophospholipase L1-like esterase
MSKGNGTYDGNCWGERIARRNNMTIDNQALNGKYLTQSFADSVVGGQVNLLSSDCDYVVIYAGTNDITNNVAVGTDGSTDISTLKGAMNTLVPMLLSKFPKAKICFITPYRRYIRVNSTTYNEPNANQQTWINTLESMCESWGIPCFNNMKKSGISWLNDVQRSTIMSSTSYPYGDDTHLNDIGIEFASTKFESFLRNL